MLAPRVLQEARRKAADRAIAVVESILPVARELSKPPVARLTVKTTPSWAPPPPPPTAPAPKPAAGKPATPVAGAGANAAGYGEGP